MALLAFVIMRPPHRLTITEQHLRPLAGCRPPEVYRRYAIRCGETYIPPTADLLPTRFMSFLEMFNGRSVTEVINAYDAVPEKVGATYLAMIANTLVSIRTMASV